mgnify:CR=1 FL=1
MAIEFNTIQKEGLSVQIANAIRNAILEGRLAGEERLPSEADLAERFGVSRPSLREAIQKLAARGLLERLAALQALDGRHHLVDALALARDRRQLPGVERHEGVEPGRRHRERRVRQRRFLVVGFVVAVRALHRRAARG